MKADERRDKKNQNNTLKVRPLILVVVQVEIFACVSSKCTANVYATELKQLSLLRRCYKGRFCCNLQLNDDESIAQQVAECILHAATNYLER